MVLSVNSSTKVVLGVSAITTLALGTILFYRYRGNIMVQQEAPSLDQGRFSFMADLPVIGPAYNYLTKPADLPVYRIGQHQYKFSSVEELVLWLGKFKMQRRLGGALVIYGDKLQITQDPGILVLEPMKLILVGASITNSCEAASLEQQMMNSGWLAEVDGITVVEVASVDEAVKAVPTINPTTSKPYPTVYSVTT
jgi:hypothetical protein